jgi:DNA-binding MarR family transcriptional regulator
MTKPRPLASAEWLTEAELSSWLSVVRLMMWLPWSIDQQLQRYSNLSMVEYQVLAMLSERPGRAMRMGSLAEVANASLSRLSHLVKRLEARGRVRREPDPADGRFTNAILTGKARVSSARASAGARGGEQGTPRGGRSRRRSHRYGAVPTAQAR